MDGGIDNSGRELSKLYGHRVLRPTPDTVSLWAPPMPGLVDESGALTAGAVAFAVDAAGGMAGGFSVWPDWVVTTQLSVHLTEPALGGDVRVDGTVLRAGRRQVVVEGSIHVEADDGDRRIGWFCIDNAILTPEVPHDIDDLNVVGELLARDEPVVVPSVLGEFGPRRDGAAVEIDVTDRSRNPWGIMHGALSALLVEQAALASAGSGFIHTLDLRFLAPVRSGPARAAGTVIGRRRGDTHVRVELTDVGADHRLCVLAAAGVG